MIKPDATLYGAALVAAGVLDSAQPGNGGDEQYRGDWYPLVLIRESYFEAYARELAEDIGAIQKAYDWPASHIDWTAAAEALQQDYTAIDFAGVAYFAR